MSLRVWLPLNGNLKNKGVDNITVTNNGATVDDGGKIGKCYSFDSSSLNYIQLSPSSTILNYIKNHSFSVCAWIKTSADGYWLSITYSYVFSAKKASVPNNSITIGNNAIDDKWHHVCYTHDNDTLKNVFYVDGVEIGSSIGTDVPTTTYTNSAHIGHNVNNSSASSSFFNGLINDVRIYDHCLSPVEVKEISRALILHYKFNDWEVVTSRCSSITWNQMINNGDFSNGTTGWSNVANSTLSVSNGEFTISKYQKGSAGGICKLTTVSGFNNTHLYYIKAVAKTNCDYAIFVGFSAGTSVGGNTQLSTTSQTYETISAIVSPVNNSDIFVIRMGTSAAPSGSSGCCKSVMCIDLTTMFGAGNEPTKEEFEKLFPKDYYSYDAGTSLSITMDIPDSSGYGNSGKIVGTASLNINTPRYDACTYMNNRSTTNHIETNAIANVDTFSVSFWLNADKDVSQVFVADPSMTIGFLSGGISVNPVSAKIFSCANFTSNEWNHIVAIKNGTEYSIYINGVQRSQLSTSTYYVHNINKLWIFNRSYNSSYAANAYISDFRIYATVLSADDVLKLYNVGGKIDNNSNLYSYEFEELFEGKELLITNFVTPYSGSTRWNNFSKNGMEFSGQSSADSVFIEINPENNIYIYDFTISLSSGNQFLLGFERYDADKTARSNNACLYVYTNTPGADMSRRRFKGIVDLSTDGVNPCKYIKLRILNGWSDSTSNSTKLGTLHNISLREISADTDVKTKLLSTGVFKTDLLLENSSKVKIEKNLDTNVNKFIEI